MPVKNCKAKGTKTRIISAPCANCGARPPVTHLPANDPRPHCPSCCFQVGWSKVVLKLSWAVWGCPTLTLSITVKKQVGFGVRSPILHTSAREAGGCRDCPACNCEPQLQPTGAGQETTV